MKRILCFRRQKQTNIYFRIRKRPVSEQSTKEELDEKHFLKKEWARYMFQQHQIQMTQLKQALKSQKLALNELKKDNINLYNMAIQVSCRRIFVRLAVDRNDTLWTLLLSLAWHHSDTVCERGTGAHATREAERLRGARRRLLRRYKSLQQTIMIHSRKTLDFAT